MDSIFLFNEGDRAAFLQQMVQSYGCTYICLWSFSPQPPNCLIFRDGIYREETSQPTTSSGVQSRARRLFDEYRRWPFDVDDGRVPGLAFKNSLPYLELKESDLQRLASRDAQLEFYQEARIKTAIFMGCQKGEIELGMSSNVDLEMEMKSLFPQDFSRQPQPGELPQATDQNRPSSSSSSLRSLSVESVEHTPTLLLDIPSSSYIPEVSQETVVEQTIRPVLLSPTLSPYQQAIQFLSQTGGIQFPRIESQGDAMTKAMLAVISSPGSSSSSQRSQQNLPPNNQLVNPRASAFKRFTSALGPQIPMRAAVQRQHTLKRAITFFRNLHLMQRSQERFQGNRPTSTQLHHVISERRRREKLNESFQALRSLLPPGSKKDKASVLANTTEYLKSLKDQVAELSRRNRILEATLPLKATQEEKEEKEEGGSGSSTQQRPDIQITNLAESTSEARLVDLQVNFRGQCSLLDMVIRIMEFLRQADNVSLVYVEAATRMLESNSVHHTTFRLKIEGDEWDSSAFQEAVRRVVDDLIQ